ncbi:MAG: hypothetical protein RR555_03750 [Bacteroidales bacterium]
MLTPQLQQANNKIETLMSQLEKLICNESEKIHPVNGTTSQSADTTTVTAQYNPKERGIPPQKGLRSSDAANSTT